MTISRFPLSVALQYVRIYFMLSNKKSAILLIVVIVTLTISLLGATLITLFFNVLTSSQIELYRASALYLAEAGISLAISRLKSQAGAGDQTQSQQIIPPTELGMGSFEVYNDFSQSTIVSIGKSHGVQRVIQVKYNMF